jgi:hypothetical protein
MKFPGISEHSFSNLEHSLVKREYGEMRPSFRRTIYDICSFSAIIFLTVTSAATGTGYKGMRDELPLLYRSK